jgi:5'-3' exonuclease
LINNSGKNINHLYSILKSISFFTSLASYPYYIFDGKTPEQKKSCIDIRKKKKEEAEDKCDTLTVNMTQEEYLKYYKRTYNIERSQILEVQELLDYLGIPFVQCLWEADPQCVAMSCYYKKIVGIVSDDADMLIFGAPRLLKNFSARSEHVKEINLDDLLSCLTEKKNKLLHKYINLYPNLQLNKELLASLKKEKPHTPCITNKKRSKPLQFTV